MRQREVYPGAPIVLVAVEVRHSLCEQLDASGLGRLNADLSQALPLRGEVQNVSATFQPGGAPSLAQVDVSPRWSSRDKRTAVTVRSDALVIETTDYQRYENLRGLLELALNARASSAGAVGIERVGLRYIDEIRVPAESDGTPTWSEWVHQSLLGPVVTPKHAGGLRLTDHQAIAVFTGENDQTLALRYGPREGYATVSTPELRRPTPAPGPFFLLDIDSFWQPSETAPAFESEHVLDAVDRLHTPVREIFEALITKRLRDEVLREE